MEVDFGTLILLAVVVILLYNIVFPMFSEGFSGDSSPMPVAQDGYNPNLYAPVLSDAIVQSPFPSLPDKVVYPWDHNTGNYGKVDGILGGENGLAGFNYNLCSPSCCSPQFPTPFASGVDSMVCASEDQFVPTSYTCNNAWQNSGCLCMTENQARLLTTRGGNGQGLN